MNLKQELKKEWGKLAARRWFLRDCAVGLGSMALSSILGKNALGYSGAGTLPRPDHPPKAKRVVYLFMAGAPSHLELFDHKPELKKWEGKSPPAELIQNYRAAFIHTNSALMGPKFKFSRHGNSGAELSEALPNTAAVADHLCFLKGMHTDAVNHAPGQILMNTGSQQFGRPSFGAWTVYGLGSESADLPGYVVLSSANGTSGGSSNWGSGFLPTIYHGVNFRSQGDPVLYLSNPKGIDDRTQRQTLDLIKTLNSQQFQAIGDPEILTRIASFEMAYRLQTSAPELMDLTKESEATLKMYGLDPKDPKPGFARNCLLARRLLERGVRFVQLFHESWDHHGGLVSGIKASAGQTDRGAAALVRDLAQRGLLDDTIVIWGGEFGRTPMVQGDGMDGRDHHNRCFTMWLAGGGFKPGITFGESDPFGFKPAKGAVHVHDLHATLLHQLGFDHTKLTYRFQGRDYRLTDVHGQVVKDII
ncbi:MAG: DUF1501 domain-containing protein [Gemmataceae bacterium]|nr:DUF1501 domain-containing protein [Gemmataceae bacterium]